MNDNEKPDNKLIDRPFDLAQEETAKGGVTTPVVEPISEIPIPVVTEEHESDEALQTIKLEADREIEKYAKHKRHTELRTAIISAACLVFVVLVGIIMDQFMNTAHLTMNTSGLELNDDTKEVKVAVRAYNADIGSPEYELYTDDVVGTIGDDGNLHVDWKIPNNLRNRQTYVEVCAHDDGDILTGQAAFVHCNDQIVNEHMDYDYNKLSCLYYIPEQSVGTISSLLGRNNFDDDQRVGCSEDNLSGVIGGINGVLAAPSGSAGAMQLKNFAANTEGRTRDAIYNLKETILGYGGDGVNGSNGSNGSGSGSGSNGTGSNGSGSNGTAGTDGSAGSNGIPGVSGAQGAAGTNGTNGANGTNGINGINGQGVTVTSEPGVDGQSCIRIINANGDIDQLICSGKDGKGEKGDKGDPGTPGTGIIYCSEDVFTNATTVDNTKIDPSLIGMTAEQKQDWEDHNCKGWISSVDTTDSNAGNGNSTGGKASFVGVIATYTKNPDLETPEVTQYYGFGNMCSYLDSLGANSARSAGENIGYNYTDCYYTDNNGNVLSRADGSGMIMIGDGSVMNPYQFAVNVGNGLKILGNQIMIEGLNASDKDFCPSGYTFDSNIGKCIQSNDPPTCPAGYAWDAELKGCYKETIPSCPAGYTYDSNTSLCKQDGGTGTETPCSDLAGFVWNAIIKKCVQEAPPTTPPTCPAGFEYNAQLKSCIRVEDGPDCTIFDGAVWDDIIGKCVFPGNETHQPELGICSTTNNGQQSWIWDKANYAQNNTFTNIWNPSSGNAPNGYGTKLGNPDTTASKLAWNGSSFYCTHDIDNQQLAIYDQSFTYNVSNSADSDDGTDDHSTNVKYVISLSGDNASAVTFVDRDTTYVTNATSLRGNCPLGTTYNALTSKCSDGSSPSPSTPDGLGDISGLYINADANTIGLKSCPINQVLASLGAGQGYGCKHIDELEDVAQSYNAGTALHLNADLETCSLAVLGANFSPGRVPAGVSHQCHWRDAAGNYIKNEMSQMSTLGRSGAFPDDYNDGQTEPKSNDSAYLPRTDSNRVAAPKGAENDPSNKFAIAQSECNFIDSSATQNGATCYFIAGGTFKVEYDANRGIAVGNECRETAGASVANKTVECYNGALKVNIGGNNPFNTLATADQITQVGTHGLVFFGDGAIGLDSAFCPSGYTYNTATGMCDKGGSTSVNPSAKTGVYGDYGHNALTGTTVCNGQTTTGQSNNPTATTGPGTATNSSGTQQLAGTCIPILQVDQYGRITNIASHNIPFATLSNRISSGNTLTFNNGNGVNQTIVFNPIATGDSGLSGNLNDGLKVNIGYGLSFFNNNVIGLTDFSGVCTSGFLTTTKMANGTYSIGCASLRVDVGLKVNSDGRGLTINFTSNCPTSLQSTALMVYWNGYQFDCKEQTKKNQIVAQGKIMVAIKDGKKFEATKPKFKTNVEFLPQAIVSGCEHGYDSKDKKCATSGSTAQCEVGGSWVNTSAAEGKYHYNENFGYCIYNALTLDASTSVSYEQILYCTYASLDTNVCTKDMQQGYYGDSSTGHGNEVCPIPVSTATQDPDFCIYEMIDNNGTWTNFGKDKNGNHGNDGLNKYCDSEGGTIYNSHTVLLQQFTLQPRNWIVGIRCMNDNSTTGVWNLTVQRIAEAGDSNPGTNRTFQLNYLVIRTKE